MRVCVILPLKIINTGVAPGRPAAYSAWLSTMPQKWSHSPIHPSIPPFIHPSLSSSSPQERTPWPFKRTTISHTHPQKSSISASIHQLVVHCTRLNGNGSHAVRYEVRAQTHMCRPANTQAKNTHIQPCVHSTRSHIHQASRRANRASGPRSLMFVKVINFLCEIRGHGGRTEGDGCQPHNLSLLSSTGTGAL